MELDTALASVPLPIPISWEGIAIAIFDALVGIALGTLGHFAQRRH